MIENVVLYHGDCVDGFTARWVASSVLGTGAIYEPVLHGQPLPNVEFWGRTVYLLDVCYPRPILETLVDMAKKLVILDHHVTARDDLANFNLGKTEIVFDMERSGAGIAWDHFFPGQERPWLVDYVEDRDLWLRRLPDTEAIHAYIFTVPKTEADYDALCRRGKREAAESGRGALAYQAAYIRDVVAEARIVSFLDHPAAVVNVSYFGISEVLAEVQVAYPEIDVTIGWYVRGDGRVKYSLRSQDPTGPHVGNLARTFGGGGHKHAAGFDVEKPLEL